MSNFIKRNRTYLAAAGFVMAGIGWGMIGVVIDSPAHQFYGFATVGSVFIFAGFYAACRERY